MDGIYMMFMGSLDNMVDVQIAVIGLDSTYTLCLICKCYVTGQSVGRAENCYGPNPHLVACTHHPNRDLTAISN